jgi:glycosyltransferase involved in cell wall biosynthesis
MSVRGDSALPKSDGVIESREVDVVHFVRQFGAFRTDVPSIYQPHDLQHLHFPEFFSNFEIAARERIYREACARAESVAVMTEWGREDLIERYGLSPDKVIVVPWASVLDSYSALEKSKLVRSKLLKRGELPERFLIYPSQTWPHKNHERLVRAVARLRDERRQRVTVICAGRLGANGAQLKALVRSLRLQDQVYFAGFLPAAELSAMYRQSVGLIFPSLFEGWGMPILEAFSTGLPVACSDVTSLPSLAAGAALLFNPRSEEAIADAIERIWEDDALRQALRRAGHSRAGDFSWDRTARLFRAHYRRVAGHDLTEEDRRLMSEPSPV